MGRRLRMSGPPDDVELYCYALDNPGVFCYRDENGDIQTGSTFTATAAKSGVCDENGDGDVVGQGRSGYFVPSENCYISASISGSGNGSYQKPNPAYPPTEPEFLEVGNGCAASASCNGGEIISKTLVDENQDGCSAVSDWVGDDAVAQGPFAPCCAITWGTSLTVGNVMFYGEPQSTGRAETSISVTMEVIPEE